MAVYKIRDLTTNSEFDAPDDVYILDSFENAGIELPYSCRAGACSTCVALLISGRVDQSDGSFLSDKQKDNYILTCASYPLSNCVIKSGVESELYGGDEDSNYSNLFENLFNSYTGSDSGKLADGLLAPVDAFYHYLFGDGSVRQINIGDVGFNIEINQISPIMDVVNSNAVGSFDISSDFGRNTMLDSIAVAAYLGSITMKTEGTLNISSDGSWNYNGVIRAYNDRYDANPSTHRDTLGEWSTSILETLSGTPYDISIPGELEISGNGKR